VCVAATCCRRNCRDKIIRHAKRLDTLTLPSLNPLVRQAALQERQHMPCTGSPPCAARGARLQVLVHSDVLAAIRAQSARAAPPARSAAGAAAGWRQGAGRSSAPEQQQQRTLADLGVGCLVRLALQLQAAMVHEPYTEWFAQPSVDAF
jgi:hypothetical protein